MFMFSGDLADSPQEMLRFGTLLLFAMIGLGQVPEKTAYISIEITSRGDVHGTLAVPGAPASRSVVQCPVARSSALTFHAAVRFDELAPLLLQAEVGRVDVVVRSPQFGSLRLDPIVAPPRGGYYHAQYSLDQLPQQITIDGGFENSQALTLAGAAVGFMLAPFLLLLRRPRDPLRLRVQMEGIFVVAWIGWIWVLSLVEGGALLSYLVGPWTLGPLLAPPLMAVWIGSRLAAVDYARLAPSGLGAEYDRRMKFWSGAAATCLATTLLNGLLTIATHSYWSVVAGLALTVACLLVMRRIGRGGRRTPSRGDLSKRAVALAAKAGVKLRGVTILTSPTPRPPLALATRWGLVLLNQGLLSQLSRREVDAILCHELSHLRPVKRSGLYVVYVVLVASILGSQWIPNFADFIPVSLLIIYFAFKAWRRAGERKADLDSVRWSGDPEAMITGLARVSEAHGMPLAWGAPVSWMMTHPPTMDRIRAIARAGRLDDSRIAELLEESRRPAVDHYMEAEAAAVPEDAAFSAPLRQRLKTRLTLFVLAAPLMAGLPAVWLLERFGLPWWAVLVMASLFSMIAIQLGSEWIVGSVRDAVKQRAVARHWQGVFAAFSPGAEPRLFDGGYHYDLGIVRLVDDALQFAGDRAQFTIDRRLVQRVWLGDATRHWTPRKVIYIECRPSMDARPVIFWLQSFEAWFWPSTVTMAKRLHRDIEEWHKGLSCSPAPPLPCALPQVAGTPTTYISFRTAFRSVGAYSGIAFVLAWVKAGSRGSWDPSEAWCSVAVCGLLALFLVWPRLQWGALKAPIDSGSRLPADS